MRMRGLGIAATLMAIGAVVAPTAAQCLSQDLDASDAGANDHFGAAVAADGAVIVVGAPDDTTAFGGDAGSVYVFERGIGGPFVETAHLLASDADWDDAFGTAVAIDGDTIVVGALYGDRPALEDTGAAYAFARGPGGAWVETSKLFSPSGGALQRAGESVAISGDVIVIGASNHPSPPLERGAVFVYAPDGFGGWGYVTTITPAGLQDGDHFGAAVALDGDRLAVSATGDDDAGEDAGAVYVFERGGGGAWTQVAKLTAPDAAVDDAFGAPLALRGDVLVVGDEVDDELAPDAGAAYVFAHDGTTGWGFAQKLFASDGTSLDRFGRGLDLTDGRLVVGAWVVGGAYLFETRGGAWTEVGVLQRPGNGDLDRFPRALALLGDAVIAGAERDDDAAPNAGRVTVFELGLEPDCDGNGLADVCDLGQGAADCDGNGILDVCDIAAGADDCDGDGVPDRCQFLETYRDDDGTAELVAWANEGVELVWLNAFEVQPGATAVTALANTWWLAGDERPMTWLIYSDPNDDGDPADAVLEHVIAGVAAGTGPDETVIQPIDPVDVGAPGEIFFVGVWMTQPDPDLSRVMSTDLAFPASGTSWLTIADPGAVDLEDLTANDWLPLAPLPDVCPVCDDAGTWMLRALTAAVAPCPCPADIDGSGAVDVADLVTLILAWGTSDPTADLDGSGLVDVSDLVALILAWGPCA